MTVVQLALDCDPDWIDTPVLSRALAHIEQQTRGLPINPCHQPKPRRRRRPDIRTIHVEGDYL